MLCAMLRPTLNIAVRVEFIARHVPSQAGDETSEDFETLFVSFTFINSHTHPFHENVTRGYTSTCIAYSNSSTRIMEDYVRLLLRTRRRSATRNTE